MDDLKGYSQPVWSAIPEIAGLFVSVRFHENTRLPVRRFVFAAKELLIIAAVF